MRSSRGHDLPPSTGSASPEAVARGMARLLGRDEPQTILAPLADALPDDLLDDLDATRQAIAAYRQK